MLCSQIRELFSEVRKEPGGLKIKKPARDFAQAFAVPNSKQPSRFRAAVRDASGLWMLRRVLLLVLILLLLLALGFSFKNSAEAFELALGFPPFFFDAFELLLG